MVWDYGAGTPTSGCFADIDQDPRREGVQADCLVQEYSLTETAKRIRRLKKDATGKSLVGPDGKPATEVIALFIESVREPERFVAALDRAAAAGKPVIVLKVGRSARTRNAITSHTGGLAGESPIFSEVLRAHRAIEVDDLDEFAEVIAACQGTVMPTGTRLGVVTASGGQAELILALAEACGLDLPPLP